MTEQLIVSAGVACTVALVLTPLVRLVALRLGLVAEPRPDRWHVRPTATFGGVAIFIAVVCGLLAGLAVAPGGVGAWVDRLGPRTIGILGAAVLMFVAGVLDDRYELRASSKLILQGIAGAVLITSGVVYPVTELPAVNMIVTMLWFLGLTNALNLLDNMDGAAVGVSAIAALFLALTFFRQGELMLATVCLALAGGALGFLPYNFHAASIFMGDSGSLFIGALLAGLGAAFPSSAASSIIPVLFVPLLIVIIPILDTSLIAVTRAVAGRSIVRGGRDHAAHRLVAVGLSERQVALLFYGFAIVGGVGAMGLMTSNTPFVNWLVALFLVALLPLAAYLAHFHVYEPHETRPKRRMTVLINDLLYKRRALEVLFDMAIFAVAYQGAYYLRWDGVLDVTQRTSLEATVALAVVSKSVAFGLLGVYRGSWRQITLTDAARLTKATALGMVITAILIAFVFERSALGPGIFIMDGVLALILTTLARSSFRLLDTWRHAAESAGAPVVIYGSGRFGELLVREMINNPALGLRPVGFVDDDPVRHGRLVHGLPVFGSLEALRHVMKQRPDLKLVLGIKELPQERLLKVQQTCGHYGVELLRLRMELEPVGWMRASPERTA